MVSFFRMPLKSVLIDLSGTLHVENTAIEGAVEALRRLRQTNLKIKFVTNTTKESRRVLYERLLNLGFDLKNDEIYSSLWAAHEYIRNKQLRPLLLLDDAAMEDFADVTPPEGSHLNAVVVGLAPDRFHYEELTKAFRLLLDGADLVAIHEARYFKRNDGLALGPGAFVKGLEYAANCKAQVLGKPTPEFFLSAIAKDNPQETIMIGDDVRDDIAGAQAIGARGILVKTGKYRAGDESKISPPPAFVCSSFAEAVDLIVGQLSKDNS